MEIGAYIPNSVQITTQKSDHFLCFSGNCCFFIISVNDMEL
jgi:hypothetical protein